jgi:hypothetical protein
MYLVVAPKSTSHLLGPPYSSLLLTLLSIHWLTLSQEPLEVSGTHIVCADTRP